MILRGVLPLLVLVSLLTGVSGASAQERNHVQPYSLASLDGEFALVGTYTGGIARQLGIVQVNEGGATGFLRVNVQSSTTNQRVVVYLSFVGTVTIAEDGTGVIMLTVTYPDQSLHQATIDFLVTKAEEGGRKKIATEIATMQRETPALSPGSLIVGTLTRRPE